MSVPAGQLPRWADYGLMPIINLAAAFLVSGLVVLFIGENPLEAVRLMIYGSLGYGEGIGFTLFYATNFIFTGLSVAVAFHCGLFNIGGEGPGLYRRPRRRARLPRLRSSSLPWWLNGAIADVAAFAFGAGLGFHPGLAPGQARQPHRHHDDHVQFHRLGADGLSPRQRARAARATWRRRHARSPRTHICRSLAG